MLIKTLINDSKVNHNEKMIIGMKIVINGERMMERRGEK